MPCRVCVCVVTSASIPYRQDHREQWAEATRAIFKLLLGASEEERVTDMYDFAERALEAMHEGASGTLLPPYTARHGPVRHTGAVRHAMLC